MKTNTHVMIIAVFLIFILSACSKDNQNPETSLVPLESRIPPGPIESISVTIKNYCPAVGRSFKDLFVMNASQEFYNKVLTLDSDYDGIPDTIENSAQKTTYNLNTSSYDTNNDYITDLLMYKLGIFAIQQPLLTCSDIADTDGDGILFRNPKLPNSAPLQFLGLRNCEETLLLHTNPSNFDSDNDGIPDFLEIRYGLNPLDQNDALLDSDGDGINNKNEIKSGTPTNVNNDENSIKQYEIKYSLQADLVNIGCYKFTINNIPVQNKGADNLIYFNFIENDTLNAPHLWTNHLVLANNSAGLNFEIIFNSTNGGFTPR